MAHVLAMADGREPRQHRCHQPARTPGPTRTAGPVGRSAGRGLAAGLRPDTPLGLPRGQQRVHMPGVDGGGGAVPGTPHAPLVQDETAGATAHPARLALALLADRGAAAAFPPRVAPRAPRGGRHAQDGGGHQQASRPGRGGRQEPCQAGARRHLGQQRQRGARQPARAGPGPAAWARMEQGPRADGTRRQCGVRRLQDIEPLLVHRVKPCDQITPNSSSSVTFLK